MREKVKNSRLQSCNRILKVLLIIERNCIINLNLPFPPFFCYFLSNHLDDFFRNIFFPVEFKSRLPQIHSNFIIFFPFVFGFNDLASKCSQKSQCREGWKEGDSRIIFTVMVFQPRLSGLMIITRHNHPRLFRNSLQNFSTSAWCSVKLKIPLRRTFEPLNVICFLHVMLPLINYTCSTL